MGNVYFDLEKLDGILFGLVIFALPLMTFLFVGFLIFSFVAIF